MGVAAQLLFEPVALGAQPPQLPVSALAIKPRRGRLTLAGALLHPRDQGGLGAIQLLARVGVGALPPPGPVRALGEHPSVLLVLRGALILRLGAGR